MPDFIPGEQYRLDILGADDSVIVDSWNSQIKADTISKEGVIQVDTTTGKLYGPFVGNIEDYDGSIVFDLDLRKFDTDIRGNVFDSDGTIVVDADLKMANVDITGNVFGRDGDVMVNATTRSIQADSIYGEFYGELIGSVRSDSTIFGTVNGDFSGTSYGDHFGNFDGVHLGTFTGDLTGNVTGAVFGNVTGHLLKNETTPLTTSTEMGDFWVGGVAHPDSAAGLGPVILPGVSREDATLIAHIAHYDGTDVLRLAAGGTVDPAPRAMFFGKFVGDVVDSNDNLILRCGNNGIVSLTAPNVVSIGDSDSVDVNIHSRTVIKEHAVQNGQSVEQFNSYRGTKENKLPVQQGDLIYSVSANAWDGVDYKVAGALGFVAHPDIAHNTANNFYPGGFGISVSKGTNVPSLNDANSLRFDGNGVLSVPVFKAKGTTFSQRDSMTPEEGMIIFNKNSKKFQGYTGSSWVDLH